MDRALANKNAILNDYRRTANHDHQHRAIGAYRLVIKIDGNNSIGT